MKMLELQLGVTKIVVIRDFGTDKVILWTNRPPPFPPEVSRDPLTVQFDTRRGYAEQYVRETFGVEVDEVIDTSAVPRTPSGLVDGYFQPEVYKPEKKVKS